VLTLVGLEEKAGIQAIKIDMTQLAVLFASISQLGN